MAQETSVCVCVWVYVCDVIDRKLAHCVESTNSEDVTGKQTRRNELINAANKILA